MAFWCFARYDRHCEDAEGGTRQSHASWAWYNWVRFAYFHFFLISTLSEWVRLAYFCTRIIESMVITKPPINGSLASRTMNSIFCHSRDSLMCTDGHWIVFLLNGAQPHFAVML